MVSQMYKEEIDSLKATNEYMMREIDSLKAMYEGMRRELASLRATTERAKETKEEKLKERAKEMSWSQKSIKLIGKAKTRDGQS